ncbi:MAG: hypothetical protein AYK19_13985 [Theionarchaea archaeon DG-70-1]|nr:MAG: hypothetical protein AYK19_13985 [Theionarchaea archaeon DG-70-1]
MRNLILWVIMAVGLLVPVGIIRVTAAFLLLTFFPGILIWSFADFEEQNPLLYLLCGAAFLTVLVYYCSWFVFFPIPLVISFGCVLVLEKRKIPLPVIDKKTVILLGCMLFMIVYLYPWGDYVDFYPPGDEMKLHLLYTNTIVTEHAFPTMYPLYPEIYHISQPLGFHGVTAFVGDASRTSFIPVATFVGIFMASLGCVSIYFLGKTLFSEEKGIAAAFSFAFLSFVSHQLGVAGSYVVLAGITLYIGAAAVLVRASRQKTRNSYILAGLFCAACLSTDMNAFFPLVLFFILFLVMNRVLFPVLAAFILFSLPQLARLTLPAPTSLELHFIQEWFQHNSITTLGELWVVLFSVGPLLLIFALLQLFSMRKFRSLTVASLAKNPYMYLGLLSIPFFVPVLLGRILPFWYVLDSVLIFRLVCIPLSLLSGLFLVQLKTLAQIKFFISGLLLFSVVVHVTDPFVILPSSSPTVDYDALSAYQWISENTATGTSFCNFTTYGDSSTWIPAVAARRIFLPFHLYYQGDNAMSRLHLPERFTDSMTLRTMPDSEFAKDILEKYGFSYVYIDEKSPVDVTNFLNSSLYRVEFHEGAVYIFSVTDGEPPPCKIIRYHQGTDALYGSKSYVYFSNLKGGSILGVYYRDQGFGNVDVEINDEYVGTVFRFDSGDHFLALFVLPSGEDVTVSFLPYADIFYIEYLVIFECG